MKARFYQPDTGRFTQLDPLPNSLLTGNRYAYASGNPGNRVDPSGQDAQEDFALCFWLSVAAMAATGASVALFWEAGAVITPSVAYAALAAAAAMGIAIHKRNLTGGGVGEY